MNPSLDKALYYLTGNGNLDELSTEDVEKLVVDYPFFSVGQLLLAKKLKNKNGKRFESQLQKTAIYITNPYWLHYQLLNYPPAEIEMFSNRQIAVNENAIEGPEHNLPSIKTGEVFHSDYEVNNNANSEIKNQLIDPSPIDSIEQNYSNNIVQDLDKLPVAITTEFTKEEIENADALAHEQLGDSKQDELEVVEATDLSTIPGSTIQNIAFDDPSYKQEDVMHGEEISFTRNTIANRFSIEEVPAEIEDIKPITSAAATHENHKTPTEEYLNEFEPIVDEPANEPPVEINQAEEEMAALARDTDPATEAFIEEIESSNDSDIEEKDSIVESITEPDEHELMFQNIKAMLDATTQEADKKVDGAIIPIDPYHTIDYFASQGIKLDFDQNPQDKLGKQVKKFTQWLRHMKKLGPEDAIETLKDEQAESHIQHIADSSNTAREVVTEAMAQVLEKQGKKEKAIQLYTKLSFFNPHKSAYFADKINKLKES